LPQKEANKKWVRGTGPGVRITSSEEAVRPEGRVSVGF